MLIPRLIVGMCSVGWMVLGAGLVFGQNPSTEFRTGYPNKAIRIVTASAGGGSDFVARQIAQGISGPLGQPVIVDNRASGLIAGEIVSKAPPNGYDLFVAGSSYWLTPLLRKVSYDVVRDFSPVSLISREVSIVAVHPALPVKSVKELIALAKAKPGELNYAMTNVGGPAHLAAELFKSMAGINMVNVPYKGGAAAITALVSGEVQLTIYDAGILASYVKSGQLRALAVTSAEPSALAPGLPTVAASGLPGYESTGMSVIFAAAKTPDAIVNRLNQEIVRFLNRAEVKERFLNAGVEAVGSLPEELAAMIRSDTTQWSKVIKEAGIKAD